MSDIETELRCRSCGQPVGAYHNNPCHYGNLTSPYVIGSQCAELRARPSSVQKRPAVEEFIRLTSTPASAWGMADSDVVDLCQHILKLEGALKGLVDALAANDEDGLTEFAPQMQAARAALDR